MKTVDEDLRIIYTLNVCVIFLESSSVWYGVIIPWVFFLFQFFLYWSIANYQCCDSFR